MAGRVRVEERKNAKGERTGWRLRWYQGRDGNGKRIQPSKTLPATATDREIRREVRAIETALDKGQKVPSAVRVPKLRDFVAEWKKGGDAGRLRVPTLRTYSYLLESQIVPALGELRLTEIQPLGIETAITEPLIAKGHNRMAALCVSALSRVFEAAIHAGGFGVTMNPCKSVQMAEAPPPARNAPLSVAERAAFREAIRGTTHELLWLVMMLTGLGPSEALAVAWDAIDLDRRELRVIRTLECRSRVVVEGMAKRRKRIRTVPLAGELPRMLRERWLAAGRPAEGLVFHGPAGEPLDFGFIRRWYFRAALKRAGITRPFRPYDLRHTFATAALESGLDPKVTQVLMGHESVATTLDTYSHVSPSRAREAAEQIAEGMGFTHKSPTGSV